MPEMAPFSQVKIKVETSGGISVIVPQYWPSTWTVASIKESWLSSLIVILTPLMCSLFCVSTVIVTPVSEDSHFVVISPSTQFSGDVSQVLKASSSKVEESISVVEVELVSQKTENKYQLYTPWTKSKWNRD